MVFRNLLFICAGNSVRSQMAEGWARQLSGGRVKVNSAGVTPIGVDPLAVTVMQQAGVDISRHTSRMISQELLDWADHIITMCDSVKPYSALFPQTAKVHHWSIPNPDSLSGTELSREQAYYQVRDDIRGRVEKLLREIQAID